MAETDSEKVVKDTLNRMDHDGQLVYFQKVCTPRYMPEPIDFLAVTPDGRSHLIEVKENARHSIASSQFKSHQQEYLTREILNSADSCTRAWIIARFYRDDVQRSHTNYFEHYFMCPGTYARKDMKLSVNECRSREDCRFLGGWEHGGWTGRINPEAGLSTKDNPTLGFDGGIPLTK